MSVLPFDPAIAERLLACHLELTGRPLLAGPADQPAAELARRLYEAPLVVLAHDGSADPRFTFANLAAQSLFERGWAEFIGLPSRFSAEAPARAERDALLARVAATGCIDDYSGVRIAKSGRRFRILRATVWNLHDAEGRGIGQAAAFADWEPAG